MVSISTLPASALAVARVGAVLCLVACGEGRQPEGPRQGGVSAGAAYLLLHGDPLSGAPVGCTPALVAEALNDLFSELSTSASRPALVATRRAVRERWAAINLVERFFGSDEAPFAWLTLNQRGVKGVPTIEARSRRDLASDLAALRLSQLELDLTRLGPMWWVPRRGNVALGLILFDVRDRGSKERLGYGTGKGEFHCGTGSFEVISLMVHEQLPTWAKGTLLWGSRDPQIHAVEPFSALVADPAHSGAGGGG